MNKEKKRQTFLLIATILVVGYYLYDRNIFTQKGIVEQVGKLTKITGNSENVEKDNLRQYTHTATLVKLDWKGKWDKDPFYYVSENLINESSDGSIMDKLFGKSNSSLLKRMELTGISWQGNSGFAIINNSIVKEGDVVGGYQIEKIAFNYVVMIKGTQSIRLSINE